ncbi:Hypothetical predicted protein [Paramuricea clavata]|uniref:Uncharacterized protein n=1 Tax=Paramuricea clavata TaxID=317549 RepID=A0A6S7ILS8_PARCT|nr:Hypothetical predicted protein [Paramuricea clavata]
MDLAGETSSHQETSSSSVSVDWAAAFKLPEFSSGLQSAVAEVIAKMIGAHASTETQVVALEQLDEVCPTVMVSVSGMQTPGEDFILGPVPARLIAQILAYKFVEMSDLIPENLALTPEVPPSFSNEGRSIVPTTTTSSHKKNEAHVAVNMLFVDFAINAIETVVQNNFNPPDVWSVTPINVDNLTLPLCSHPDQQKVDYVLSGLHHGCWLGFHQELTKSEISQGELSLCAQTALHN